MSYVLAGSWVLVLHPMVDMARKFGFRQRPCDLGKVESKI